MRSIAKFIAVSTIALSAAAMAAPSQAQTFANWVSLGFATNFAFINDGSDTNADGLADSGAGGHFFTTSTAGGTTLGSTEIMYNLNGNLVLADLTFDSSVANTAAGFDGATYTQTGLDGSFTVTAHGTQGSVTDGSNLLSGGFTDAWIQGIGSSGGIDLSLGNGGFMSTAFTSAYYDFSNADVFSENFNITLGATLPGITRVASTDALQSFRAVGAGGFQGSDVPEPATWALMITGFGGMGVMLRRRRQATFA